MAFKSTSSSNRDGRGGTEPKKKAKKTMTTSVKLSKTPSLKQSARRSKARLDRVLDVSFSDEGDDACSEPRRMEVSGTSPNFMKDASCSDSKKESSEERNEFDRDSVSSSASGSATSSISSSSTGDSVKMRETEFRKVLKKSRSRRFGTFGRPKSRLNQPVSSFLSNLPRPLISVAAASPNYLKATSCSEGKKMRSQENLNDSESSVGSTDGTRRYSLNSQSNSGPSSLKSMQTFRRTSSLRTLRIAINKSSSKSKRSFLKKSSQVAQDQSVNRATCSSALKDAKFPHRVGLHPGEMESETISGMKICKYNYCSLHGHHHSSPTPLKRLLSRRRRLQQTRKSMKLRSHPAGCPDHMIGEIETRPMDANADPELQDIESASTVTFPAGKEEASDSSAEIYSKARVGVFGGESAGNEDANIAEVLSGETSYPQKGVLENLNQERSVTVSEQDIHGTFSECCPIESSSSPHSLNPDNSATACYDEDPSLNLGFHELENANSTGISGESSITVSRAMPDDVGEATEDNSVISSTSVSQSLEETCAVINDNVEALATDNEPFGRFSPVRNSLPNSLAPEVYKFQLQKKKHISMWHLIHQHMVSGLDAGVGKQLREGTGEENVDGTNKLPAEQASSFSPCFSDTHQNMSTENHDTDNQEIELQKTRAIKMVREAIEKILLPEVQDQSSDDQATTSDITSDQELLEKNHNEGGKQSISNKISGPQQDEMTAKEGDNADKRAPKRWSNLKKLIILKRFIKELGKVRNFNLQKPQHLPLEHDQEAEKVSLRHQAIDKKKSAEEWMLDFALQQVVSELAPTQKRKVALLIKAFETVVPPSDEQQIQVTFPKIKVIKHECCRIGSGTGDRVSDASYRDTKVECIGKSNTDHWEKNSFINNKQSDMSVDEKAEEEIQEDGSNRSAFGQTMGVNDLSGVTGKPSYTSQIDDSKEECIAIDNIDSSASSTGPFEKLTVSRVQCGDSDSEVCKENDTEPNNEKLEVDNLTSVTAGASSTTKCPTSDDLVEPAANNTLILEELNGDSKNNDGEPELGCESVERLPPDADDADSEHDIKGHEAYETNFHKENHISMWHLIHQHLIAGLDSENEGCMGNAKTLSATDGSTLDCHTQFPDEETEYHDMGSQEVEIHKTFAIKMVREAIEKILLPEVQDQLSDDQSTISEIMADQGLMEKSSSESGEPSISSSIDSARDSSVEFSSSEVRCDMSLNQEVTRLPTATVSESEDDKASPKVQNKSEKQTPKGWSYLKKAILLNRFIKELEKVKKLNPIEPSHLPSEPGPQVEKVCLKRQILETKSTEGWMLDYALQKAVSELAPKQKRKVALLVKAFETVLPPFEEPNIQVAVNEEAQGEVPKDAAELKQGSELTVINEKMDGLTGGTTPDGTRESTRSYKIASPPPNGEPMGQLKGAKGKKNGDSETDVTSKIAQKTQMGREKYISMWHLLCQEVVSGIVTKVETQFLDGDNDDELVNGANTAPHDYSGADHAKGKEDYTSSSQKVVFSQKDAAKLVKEAIEEILPPEDQDDSSDAQSIASDISLEQEVMEKSHCQDGEPTMFNSIDSPNDSSREYDNEKVGVHNTVNPKENGSAACENPTPNEQRAVSVVGNKSDLQRPKNWNKLKKIVLLKRSIKALEKARKYNLQLPQSQPMESGLQEQRVDPRHQLKDEREKAREWMLDYAVQHIVTKLTPSRKRRVSMLVEAFEAVVPLPEI
ncbi:calmodulin binding protein PICBP-like isoform X2 [Diospyros lotus]|uniref:calmodulin binding protein PICBP-like isoform X2 n=1 Tax=Diospyros lotus TaxID=55363 RepID=UPI00225BA0B6|nr:calmodulin binding protein PICBP-like isoform X2 [Diospyros lotus]